MDKFYWGAGTSSHQVEGGMKNDWAEWELKTASQRAKKAKEKSWPDFILNNYPSPLQEENYISGKSCDQYNRYEEDFDIAKSLGHNGHKFSIEWSRIEPEEGRFDEKELEHYAHVIKALKDRGIEPFVVLWHWGNPVWIKNIGGWENKKTVGYYLRYVKKFIEYPGIGDSLKFILPLNEFQAYLGYSYLGGVLSPQEKSLRKAHKVFKNLIIAQKKAHELIHKIVGADIMVGASHYVAHHSSFRQKFLNEKIVNFIDYMKSHYVINKIGKHQDFLGIQYYRHERLRFSFGGRYGIARIDNENLDHTDMGWEIYPQGIYHILKSLQKYNLPIFVTENGLADARDVKRGKFIKEHAENILKAKKEGVDVKGYFYWSLIDNLELAEGFWPRFGLVEVNYKTQERKIRPSAWEYKKIIEESS